MIQMEVQLERISTRSQDRLIHKSMQVYDIDPDRATDEMSSIAMDDIYILSGAIILSWANTKGKEQEESCFT